jgi:hypothetical protein
VLVLAIVLVAGRHTLFRAVLTSRVESALGVELAGAKFFASLNGTMTVQDVVLRAPGIEGEAGVVMSAERFSAKVDFVGLLSGAGTKAITNVSAYRPVIRVSQHAVLGSMNIDPIIRASSIGVGGAGAVYLPDVEVVEATLEFGEHSGEVFAPLATMRAQGVLEAPDRAEPHYELRLSEITNEARPRMQIHGEIDMRASNASLHLVDLDLSAWAPSATPSNVRGMWSQMALRGTARDAQFHYEPDAGITAEFQFEDVDLAIPVPVPSEDDPDKTRPLRMRGVDGFFRFDQRGIQADLAGVVEDVTGSVQLRTHGIGMNDAFESTIRIEPFFFAEGSSLLPFAPPEALEILELFETPQALLDGEVRITRAEAGGAISVEGEFDFEDGGMAYVDFPYPVRDVRGRVAFDDAGIELIGLHGFGSGGSLLEASGKIIGYDDDAGVDIVIHGQGVPTDEVLRRSLPESWRPMFGVLFDEAHTERLRERNLVQSSQEHDDLAAQVQAFTRRLDPAEDAEARAQLDVLGGQLRRPVFDPGGLGETKIHIYRQRAGEYKYDVDVLFPTLWIMPEPIPFPMAAEQVVVEVRDTVVQVRAPIVRGLGGGLGEGLITVDLARGADEAEILIETTLAGVPVDEYLFSSLPKVEIFKDRPEGSTTLPGLLRDMRWEGSVDVDLLYDTGAPIDPLTLGLRFDGLRSGEEGVEAIALDDMRGDAQIGTRGFQIGPLEGSVYGAPGTLTISGELGVENQGVVVDARVEQLAVDSPMRGLIAHFTSAGARAIESLQQTFRPTGGIDLDISVDTYGEGTGNVTVRATNARDVAFDWLEDRFTMTSSSGALVYDSNERRLLLRSWQGPLTYAGVPSGTIEATGVMLVGEESPLDIQMMLRDLRFESKLVHDALLRAPEMISTFVRDNKLGGSFDAYLRPVRDGEAMRIERGWIEPTSVMLAAGETTTLIDSVEGRIEFTPESGRVDGLRLRQEHWELVVDGGWRSKPTWQADLGVSIDSFGFDDSLRSLLPARVRESLGAMEFDIAGPWRLEGASLTLASSPTESFGEFGGSLVLTDASMKTGLTLSELIGRVDLFAHWDASEASSGELDITAHVAADSLRVSGIPLHDVSTTVESDGRRTRIVDVVGRLNSGNVAGEVELTSDIEGRGPRFAADLRAAGVDLGLFLDAVGSRDEAAGVVTGRASGRGLVSGQVMVSGRAGEDVIGRGLLLAEQGTLVDMPFLMGVVELSNLQVPAGEDITYGEVEFALENGLVTVDHIEAMSKSLRVFGTGTVSLASGEVDLYFRTTGRKRVPVISNVVDALRRQIVAARVTGTIEKPSFRAQALPSASRILRQLLRGESGSFEPAWVGVSQGDAPLVTMEP